MRLELKEMEERKKRVSSLVVRGLRVGSAGEAATKFGEVIYALTGERTTWTEVCRIRTDTDLFRGNVRDNRMVLVIRDSGGRSPLGREATRGSFTRRLERRSLVVPQTHPLTISFKISRGLISVGVRPTSFRSSSFGHRIS